MISFSLTVLAVLMVLFSAFSYIKMSNTCACADGFGMYQEKLKYQA